MDVSRRGKSRRLSIATTSDWSKLVPELLETILSKLSFVDILRFQKVCSSWRSVAQSFVYSPSYTPCRQVPWLMFYRHDNYFCFLNAEGNKIYRIKKAERFEDGVRCIGSSDGWLVFDAPTLIPYLLNPFSQVTIELPCLSKYKRPWKAALMFETPQRHDYIVVVICRFVDWGSSTYVTKLVFYKSREDRGWNTVDGATQYYCAIVFHKNLLYALSDRDSVEAWDLQTSPPTQRMHVKPPRAVEKSSLANAFMVESSENLLLVKSGKKMGDYNMRDNELDFDVFGLDFCQQSWVKLKSLGDQVIFLNFQKCFSVSAKDTCGCKGSLIYYFTSHGKLKVVVYSQDPFDERSGCGTKPCIHNFFLTRSTHHSWGIPLTPNMW